MLYNLVFFALLMMGAAILVGQISIGIEKSVIVSLGLTAISVIGIFIAVFIGVGLVSKEMDKRTLYALAGQAGGALAIFAGKVWRAGNDAGGEHGGDGGGIVRGAVDGEASAGESDWYVLVAVYLILLKLALDRGAGDVVFLFHHTVSGDSVHGGNVYRGRVRGRFADDADGGDERGDNEIAAGNFLRMLPNFENFNVMGAVAHQRAVPASWCGNATLYAVVYAAVVLVIAAVVFSRRNLK